MTLTIGIARADTLPHAPVRENTAPDARTPTGLIVTRNHARREVTAWVVPAEPRVRSIAPTAARLGRLIVRNRSSSNADVYLALPADEPQWEFIEELPTGFKLIVRNLTRRAEYLIAAEATANYDGSFDWGPRSFFMRKRYRFTLLD